jgi:hypothetical protein
VALSIDGARVEQARIKPIAGEGHDKWNRKANEKCRDQQEPKQSAASVAVLGGVRDFAVGESSETVPIRKLDHTSLARALLRVNGTSHLSTDSVLRTICLPIEWQRPDSATFGDMAVEKRQPRQEEGWLAFI